MNKDRCFEGYVRIEDIVGLYVALFCIAVCILIANSVSQNSSSIFTCLYVCVSVLKRDISIYLHRLMF